MKSSSESINYPAYAVIGLLSLLLLTSCSIKEEGAIDYRKAEVFYKDEKSLTKFSENGIEVKNYQGELMRAARLQRKNVLQKNPNTVFKDGDKITIRLVSAYINDFTEGFFSWANDAFWEGEIIPRGEIAVVVNDFPFTPEMNTFDFSGKGLDEGKVVFYSDDIEAGQFMNFNNMPIYGPSSTGMHGMGLSIWIMELDISDKITASLLQTMASHGAKRELPDLSPGNTILKALGKNILESGSNDTNFLYRVLLEPNKDALLPHPSLEVGHYVFIRAHTPEANIPVLGKSRATDINWAELILDENTGRLYKRHLKKISFNHVSRVRENLETLIVNLSRNMDLINSIEGKVINIESLLMELEQSLDEITKHISKTKVVADQDRKVIHQAKALADKTKVAVKDVKVAADQVRKAIYQTKTLAAKSLADEIKNLVKIWEELEILMDSVLYSYKEYKDFNYLVIRVDKDDSPVDIKIENEKYNAFISGNINRLVSVIADIELNKLMQAFDTYFEATTKTEATAKNELLNKFVFFWDDHISHSLIAYFSKTKGYNRTLSNKQLGEIAVQLHHKIKIKGKEKVDITNCDKNLFRWLTTTINGKKAEDIRKEVDKIRNGLIKLIENNECPTTNPTNATNATNPTNPTNATNPTNPTNATNPPNTTSPPNTTNPTNPP